MSELSELCGKGWTVVAPPRPIDDDNVICRYNGNPINGGLLVEELEDGPERSRLLFRSGKYDIEVKIDYSEKNGAINVTEAAGYNNED